MALLNSNLIFPVTHPDGTVSRTTMHLNQVISHPRMEIGDYSYYTHYGRLADTAEILAPYLYPESQERLIIGKFVQIARGAYFVTSSANHPMAGVTTYPFRIFNRDTFGYKNLPVKDTVVESDVWIGHNAVVMPGVRIGAGAIIAAASVVTRDVPSYAVVGGNPARIIRMRFPDETIEKLLNLAWWDWPPDRIERNLSVLEAGDPSQLFDVQEQDDQQITCSF